MSTDNQAIEVQKKPYILADVPLVAEMAKEYGFGDSLEKFQATLINTVFPGNVQVTNSQFLIFIKVAQQYNLNPLTKQIYAFPSKGGGIVPIVSIDGWITVVQRQQNYNGHKFVYEWENGKVGGKILSCTCQIYRKDLENPIEHSEFFEECNRDTEPWKKWPRRMLTHKAFIQAARYTFGLTGIYDEDEGQRIIDAEMVTVPTLPAIKQPQRLNQPASEESVPAIAVTHTTANLPIAHQNTYTVEVPQQLKTLSPEVIAQSTPVIDGERMTVQVSDAYELKEGEEFVESEDGASKIYFTTEDVLGATAEPTEEPSVETTEILTGVFEDKPEPPKESAVENKKPGTIGAGRARRIYAILNKNKIHSEDELKSEILVSLKIEHLRDLPEKFEADIVAWAEGKKK